MMRKHRRLIILPLLLLSLLGCSRKSATLEPPPTGPIGGQLVCAAESEEQAREIAELYGIEFVKFGHGLAVFRSEEDLYAVIQRGKYQGWPELTVDGQSTIG